jgi:hypothetical protein
MSLPDYSLKKHFPCPRYPRFGALSTRCAAASPAREETGAEGGGGQGRLKRSCRQALAGDNISSRRARAAVVLPASAPQRAHRPLESIVSNVFPASFRNRLARGRTGSPGRAHGDRRVQHAGTAGDSPGVCRPHALDLDVSPARQQPLCRGASRPTPRGEPCGAPRHLVRWGGHLRLRGAQAYCSSLRAKHRGATPQRARDDDISTDDTGSSWRWFPGPLSGPR